MGLLTAFGDLLRELIKFDSLKQLAPLLSGTAIAFRFTEAIWKWNEQRSETARRQALADERRDLESLLAGMPATSGTGPDDDESRLRIAVNQRLAQVNTELALTIAALAKPRQTSAAPIQRISWRRQLLVYWPSRQAAYVAHLCAWGAFAFVGIASIGVLADGFDEESAVALMLVTITALLTREWALSAEYDPPPARHHSFLRRAFLFYRPTRAIGWWSHVAFWYLVALVVGLAIESLSNQDYAMLGYSAGSGAFIAFLVHAWARHFDHSASTIGPASRTDHVGEAQIALQQPPRRHRAAAQSSWKPQQLLLLLVLCGGALLVGLLVGAGRTSPSEQDTGILQAAPIPVSTGPREISRTMEIRPSIASLQTTSTVPPENSEPAPSSRMVRIGRSELGFVRVRQLPNINSPDIGVVLPDHEYVVDEIVPGWFRLRDGGWVSSRYAKLSK